MEGIDMVLGTLEPAARFRGGASNRRQFLAGAVGAALSLRLRNRGGEIVARQADVAITTDYLTVPGARLYYEVAGSGPVLLFIPGGPADAEGFAPVARFLEERCTVVRYDPRGISRSRLEGAATEVPVPVHADDARRLLQEIGDEPAYVLGHSGGGVIGLALVERHPELVKTYVAHEPPLVELLPEGDERRHDNQAIYDTYIREGIGPAMAQFMAAAGMDEPEPQVEMSPEAQEEMARQMARMEQNLDFFFAHYLMPITTYLPDFDALQASSTSVLVGVGEASAGQEAYDTALALAARLGTEPLTFPGDHGGPSTHPEQFAGRLHEILQAN